MVFMPSASLMRNFLLLSFLFASLTNFAQENSPYSRYGLGDIFPNQNIGSRAMGGLTTSVQSYQHINFSNPASYGRLSSNISNGAYINFDIGLTMESRTLKQGNPLLSFKTNNLLPAYLAFGVPLSKKKDFGVVVGLKPVTRINYNILNEGRFPASQVSTKDSFQYHYEGNGGLNQAFVGFGKSFGGDVLQTGSSNFKIGANIVYNFGKKETNTFTTIVNDSVFHLSSQHSALTSFDGLSLELGATYDFKLKENFVTEKKTKSSVYILSLGATTAFKRKLNASQDDERKTVYLDGSNVIAVVDSVRFTGLSGKVVLPAKYSGGISVSKYAVHSSGGASWQAGIQYETEQWGNDYLFMGAKDKVTNSSLLRIGGELTPSFTSNNYFNLVTYRAGFFTGTDYLDADGNKLKLTGITAGFSFPVVSRRSSYTNQFTRINTAVEWMKRGSVVNNISENYFRFSLSLSLSDIWFIKRKYD